MPLKSKQSGGQKKRKEMWRRWRSTYHCRHKKEKNNAQRNIYI